MLALDVFPEVIFGLDNFVAQSALPEQRPVVRHDVPHVQHDGVHICAQYRAWDDGTAFGDPDTSRFFIHFFETLSTFRH